MIQFRLLQIRRLHIDAATPATEGTSAPVPAATGSQPEPIVVYGKPEGDPAAPEPSQTPAVPDPAARTMEYAKVKEAYKDLYQADFNKALDARFKSRDSEVKNLKGIVEPLLAHFGMNDISELAEFVGENIVPHVQDSDIYRRTQAAQKPDNGAEDYTEADVTDSAARWVQEGQDLATRLSAQGKTFDLESELKNPKFEKSLKAGMSVEDSWKLAHYDEIVLEQAAKAAVQERQKVVQGIRTAGMASIQESAIQPTVPMVHKPDPSTWSDQDMDRVREQVMRRGKQIRL
jgi:hypothetical protein